MKRVSIIALCIFLLVRGSGICICAMLFEWEHVHASESRTGETLLGTRGPTDIIHCNTLIDPVDPMEQVLEAHLGVVTNNPFSRDGNVSDPDRVHGHATNCPLRFPQNYAFPFSSVTTATLHSALGVFQI